MKSMISCHNQVAIVTGAGSGIGRATALLLAARGASVVVNDPGRDQDSQPTAFRAVRVTEEIRDNGGQAVANTLAVGTRDAARQITSAAIEAFGHVDILINNAGIACPGDFDAVADEDIDQVMAVNLLGPYALMRAVWTGMRNQGYGRIVNMSSSAALGSGISGPYAVSKGGLLSLTREAALAGRESGILVNALMPSAHTPLLNKHPDPAYRQWMQRHLHPDRVAAVAVFLASDEAASSGEVFTAGGGRVSRLAFLESAGYFDPDLTPESVRDNLTAIRTLQKGSVVETQSDHQRNLANYFAEDPPPGI